MASEVAKGLAGTPKQLPSKFLYDPVGVALFEAIEALPEFGLAPAERRLYCACATEVASAGPFSSVIDLSPVTGANSKVLLDKLLFHQGRITYTTVDPSQAVLERCSRQVATETRITFESIPAQPLQSIPGLIDGAEGPTLLIVSSNRIGEPFDQPLRRVLERLRPLLRTGDTLLLGTDLIQGPKTMIQAYNDPIGLHSALSRNWIQKLNADLEGDLDLCNFDRNIAWNDRSSSVEIAFTARQTQSFRLPGTNTFGWIEAGEQIALRTGSKYMPHEISSMLHGSGFTIQKQWIDHKWPYCVTMARVPESFPLLQNSSQ